MATKCERCANRTTCEYVPYDIECADNFQEVLTREQMTDNLIHKYGFENPIVVMFADMCEKFNPCEWNDSLLQIFYEANMAARVGE